MDFKFIDQAFSFAYEHPAYAWVIAGTFLIFLGLLIKPIRRWLAIPGTTFFITGILVFLNIVPAESYLIQALCCAGFLAVVIACYE